MTKRQLLANLASTPISIQRVATIGCCRVAPHGDEQNYVVLAADAVSGTLVVDDYVTAYIVISGRRMAVTSKEIAPVVRTMRDVFQPVAKKHFKDRHALGS